MSAGTRPVRVGAAAVWLLAALRSAQPNQSGGYQPDFVRQGQQLLREGKPDQALSLYETTLKANPDSLVAHNAAGTLLDLVGKGDEARQHFQQAIERAPNPAAKVNAQRAMAMSWAFSGNCQETVEYEQMVLANCGVGLLACPIPGPSARRPRASP